MAKKQHEQISKSVQDMDLYIARSLMILRAALRQKEAVGPATTQDMLRWITEGNTIPSDLQASSEISPLFLKSVKAAIETRNKNMAAGNIPKYEPTPEQMIYIQEREIDDICMQIMKTGSTVISSDYVWAPEKIKELPDLIKNIEAKTGKKIKVHEPSNLPDVLTHREKKEYMDTQLWIYTQILPVIKLSIDTEGGK